MSLVLLATVLSGSARQAAPQQEPETDVFRVGPGITHPELVYKVEPEYSEAALKAGIQGAVLLDLVIDQQGLPQDIAVLSPLGFGLDERALQSVSQWRFKPATKDGEPVKVQAQVEVNFRLLGKNFDRKAEEQRIRFNAIVTRTARQKDKSRAIKT
jgi:TonB family protein